MEITSLYIDDYKLLKKFNINFSKDVSILIGVNGSGKSTILECIAQIFSDAYLEEKSKFGFKISYEVENVRVIEETSAGSFDTKYRTIKVSIFASKKGDDLVYKINGIENKDITRYIDDLSPSNIVIYYSGLSEIMKQICLPHDEKLSIDYRKGNQNSHRPFFYFEPQLFNLILISLLSYEFGDVPVFLKERAKINGFQSLTISIKKPSWSKGKLDNWWGAKVEVKSFLDYLASLQKPLIIEEDSSNSSSSGNVVMEAWQNETLLITIIGQEKLFEIREHFIEERSLFKILNTLLIDGFDPQVKFAFIQEGEDAHYKNFNVLSEGEQQAIIIRGLVELTNDENTLFLFDEPDTYLHPSWQRNFIEDINELTNDSEFNNSQFLITTHSPQLLSNADPSNSDVQIMEDGEIVKITPKYYGKDVSTILYEMMGVERRNVKVAKLLSVLFNLIEDEELLDAKVEYTKLVQLLGEDDPAMIRAKIQLDYLEESANETNS
jgi:predicted ATPase